MIHTRDILTFRVPSSDGKTTYLVDLSPNGQKPRCDCSDWRCRKSKTGEPCKHIIQAKLYLADRVIADFNKLYPPQHET